MRKAVLALLIPVMLVSTDVVAGTKSFQASLTPDAALHSRRTRIEGLTVNVWGENEQVAIALGLINGTRNDSVGFMWSFALNYSERYSGVQWAVLNACPGDFFGWQAGMVNYSGDTMIGLQSGVVNVAERLVGVQFGFLNIARKADPGVQVGMVNLISETSDWFNDFPREIGPAMVFVNWRF